MNTTHRILIAATLTVLASGASAARMEDVMDATRPDLSASAASDGARGARTEDVVDRPTNVRSSGERRLERAGTRSSRNERQPQRKAPRTKTRR